MRVMLYCQHVLGVGHFFRSMEIARAFKRHEVLFVEGGEPLADFTPPSHVERVFLPPLMMDADFSRVETRGGELDEIKYSRKRLIEEAFRNFAPNVFLIELFPFGRKYFKFELLPLLQAIKQEALPVKVVCSLRDILVEKKDQTGYEERVIRILNTFFDLLLIHSDPQLIRLNETFSRVKDIDIPIEYTGFVTRQPPHAATADRTGLIVVSGGGSPVGKDLLAAAISAGQSLPERKLRLRAFASPFMESDDLDYLEKLAAKDERTTLLPFSSEFLSELAAADLSISMAGYNTCMDILSSGVKALVYPFPQNREQRTRAEKLQELGVLTVLETLRVDYLAAQISAKMKYKNPHPAAAAILKDGAANTVHIVEKYFSRL